MKAVIRTIYLCSNFQLQPHAQFQTVKVHVPVKFLVLGLSINSLLCLQTELLSYDKLFYTFQTSSAIFRLPKGNGESCGYGILKLHLNACIRKHQYNFIWNPNTLGTSSKIIHMLIKSNWTVNNRRRGKYISVCQNLYPSPKLSPILGTFCL